MWETQGIGDFPWKSPREGVKRGGDEQVKCYKEVSPKAGGGDSHSKKKVHIIDDHKGAPWGAPGCLPTAPSIDPGRCLQQ